MFALRFASLFLLAATLASASPAPAGLAVVDKRAQTAGLDTIFTKLKSSTDSILPQIDALASSGRANEATVTPLIGKLTTAINTATTSVSALPISSKRQTEEAVATVLAGVISEISTTLEGLAGSAAAIPGLPIPIDTALAELLVALDVVAFGLVTLVSGILTSLAVLLPQIGLGSVAALLGL
ncbi:hypothetical protein DFH06DRAFT_1483949 [Mycena polygramma]|nr:hypothetical protein DFH06DRAFT_1483949 [Mycena polygramma]